MMKRNIGRNLQQKPEPDCCTCYLRKTCERYQENSFCTQWASKAPEERKPDPNEQWEKGEDVEF